MGTDPKKESMEASIGCALGCLGILLMAVGVLGFIAIMAWLIKAIF